MDKYSGTVIVCGSAPCLLDEYQLVKENRKDAMTIAVNDSAAAVYADFLVSLHPERMLTYRSNSLNPDIITISGSVSKKGHGYDVDYWLRGTSTGATSLYSGVLTAKKLGFDEIIIVGAPMIGGDGYFNQKTGKSLLMTPRFGFADPNKGSVKAHQEALKQHVAQEDVSMIRSCCGLTADLFGKPDFIKG